MKHVWAGLLLLSLPISILTPMALAQTVPAQRGMDQRGMTPRPVPQKGLTQRGLAQTGPVLRETVPPDRPDVITPQDDTVTSTPLPPPDQDMTPDATPELVPNPLDEAPGTSPPQPGSRQAAQPQGQPQRGGWVQMGTAALQVLDKVNARGDNLVVKAGDTGHFGSLDITVRGCFVRTSDRPADATAYLVIRDQRAEAPSFSGWMVRSAPYMSMMAHPIYDVRVSGCSP